ncbi:uncharacterized protein LOC128730048 [Anopheles nili]|uniref:uncharacterized protein LOC128730048 n=1 Tax=Anopheles nili TaxID=185578 RepID=UPI00237C3558|nr:uncharacterized protein LOC128730048 [Anopheles nili]
MGIMLVTANHPVHKTQKRAVSGNPNAAVEKIMEKGMVFASEIVNKLKDNEGAKKLIGKVLETIKGQRGKRSLQIAGALTNYNFTQYQKLELRKIFTSISNEYNDTRCPIGQNELNWIETVTIALQHALAEMNKILNGQKIHYTIAKPTPAP